VVDDDDEEAEEEEGGEEEEEEEEEDQTPNPPIPDIESEVCKNFLFVLILSILSISWVCGNTGNILMVLN
jgi:hypothetical protein